MPDDMEQLLGATVKRVDSLEVGQREIQGEIAKINRDITEIRTLLGNTATKIDIADMRASLSAKIDTSINGILTQALNAVPARQATIFAAVSAIVLVIGLVLTIIGVKH